MVSGLFKRFVGSATGYEARPEQLQIRMESPRQQKEIVQVPVIEAGVTIGYTTMSIEPGEIRTVSVPQWTRKPAPLSLGFQRARLY